MNFCKIYVVGHKDFKTPKDNMYIPIQVGNNSNNFFSNGVRDNTGDNISEKNINYCELTAVYWLWKNVTELENIGICHYRRYFTYRGWSKNEEYFLNSADIKKILDQYDAIVPKKFKVIKSVEYYYLHEVGRKKDVDKLIDIVSVKYPAYLNSLNKVLNAKSAFYCNMVIMSKKNYDLYCEWLFDILFELEKQTDLTGYSKVEERIYGYLSEFLLDVWMEHNNLRLKYLPVVNTEVKFLNKFKRSMKHTFQRIIGK